MLNLFSGLDEEFRHLQGYIDEHKERMVDVLEPRQEPPERLIGHNVINYLQMSLRRSLSLLDGAMVSLEQGLVLPSLLATRAHVETTGAVGFLLKRLRQFYEGRITEANLDKSLWKLCLGTRTYPTQAEMPSPINVLTLLDTADEVLYADFELAPSLLRTCYSELSEFCHPNFLGMAEWHDIDEDTGTVRYRPYDTIRAEHVETTVTGILLSVSLYIRLYDSTLQLLTDHEELPIMWCQHRV